MSSGKSIAVNEVEIGGVGAPNDSLLVSSSQSVGEVYLPLRHTADYTSFFFRYTSEELNTPSLVDTLSLGYTSEPYFASEECGAVYRYNIRTLSYTRHIIDSIGLLDSVVNNANLQRMHIYFRTD